jgi:hypothetical protein
MRTHRGTIAMQKISILIIVGLILFAYAKLLPASQAYWEDVGPQWDRMLNPCDYEHCEDTSS